MRTGWQIAEFESDASVVLDVIGILAIVASVPAYVLLLSLVVFVTLPVYLLTSGTSAASKIERRINDGKRILDDSTENKCKTFSSSVSPLDT